jgi:hypothetical protein
VSPDAAIEFCDQHCAGTDGEGVRQVIAAMMAHSDGRKAMEWLRSSSEADETERLRAANVTFSTWAGVSRSDAWDWARSLPVETRTEPWLSPVVRRMASRMGWKKSLEALAWAEAMSSEVERERAQVRIVRRWRQRDEASAEAWLESSSLSEEAREAARTAPDKKE